MNNLTLDARKRQLEVLRKINNWTDAQYQQALANLERQHGAAQASSAAQAPAHGRAAVTSGPVDPKLQVAPYRFVAIADAVVTPENDVAEALEADELLARPLDDGYCGEIEVEWAAETPLLIGATKHEGGLDVSEPLRLGPNGDWWIPGASLRGMIRTAAEIVGHGRLEQVNREHVFPLRDFEHADYNGEDGYGLGKAGAIKAGWLWRTGETPDGQDAWAIEPSELAFVEMSDLLRYLGNAGDGVSWNKTKLEAKYALAKMARSGVADFSIATQFSPGATLPGGQQFVAPDARGGRKGVLVFSGPIPPPRPDSAAARNPKHLEYAFMTLPGARDRVALRPETFARFHYVHTTQGAKKREPVGSWKTLEPMARAGRPVPVFYVGDLSVQEPRRFAFGLTRLFRVPHRYSIGDKIDATLKAHARLGPEAKRYEPDFVSALFGFVHEEKELGAALVDGFEKETLALKGRIAFSGARIAAAQATVTDKLSTVNMAPHPSFAPFYLAGATKDWSDADSTLAGRKRYLPRATGHAPNQLDAIRQRLQQQIDVLPPHVQNNARAQTHMKFLRPGQGQELRFQSRIRLHNATAAEIGLVLFALTHGGDGRKPYRHMIGRAKPYGAGQLRVVAARLNLEANTRAGRERLTPAGGGDGSLLCAGPSTPVDDYGLSNCGHAPFLEALKKHMRAPARWIGDGGKAGLANFPDCPAVRQFLGASDPAEGAKLKPAAHEHDKTSLYLTLKDHRTLRVDTQKDKSGRAKRPQPARLLPAPEKKP